MEKSPRFFPLKMARFKKTAVGFWKDLSDESVTTPIQSQSIHHRCWKDKILFDGSKIWPHKALDDWKILPLNIDDWKMIISFWGPASFMVLC